MIPNDPLALLFILGGFIFLVFILGVPLKPVKFFGQGIVKIIIGALFLFFLNTFGTLVGVHVPINFITAAVSGFLGIPGLLALVAIEQFIL